MGPKGAHTKGGRNAEEIGGRRDEVQLLAEKRTKGR